MRIADATTCAAIALVIATAVATTALAAEPHIVGREHNTMSEVRVAVYGFQPVLANIDAMEAEMEPRDDRRNDPEFLAYYVGVLMREARARRGTAFCSTLVGWARRANQEAVRHRRATPTQLALFA